MFLEKIRKHKQDEKNFEKSYQTWLLEQSDIENRLSELSHARDDLLSQFNLDANSFNPTININSSSDSESDESLEIQNPNDSLCSIDKKHQVKQRLRKVPRNTPVYQVNPKRCLIEEVFESETYSVINQRCETNEIESITLKSVLRWEIQLSDSDLDEYKNF